jgi:hypothetical protein
VNVNAAVAVEEVPSVIGENLYGLGHGIRDCGLVLALGGGLDVLTVAHARRTGQTARTLSGGAGQDGELHLFCFEIQLGPSRLTHSRHFFSIPRRGALPAPLPVAGVIFRVMFRQARKFCFELSKK